MSQLFDKLGAFGLKTEELKNVTLDDPKKAGGAAGAAGAPALNLNDYVFKRTFSCPVCGKDFENAVVRGSRVRLINTDTDLKPLYEPVDPLYYDVALCTHCGYAATLAGFSKISDNAADAIKAQLSTKFVPKTYPLIYSFAEAIERYQLALLCSVIKNGKNSEKAYLCLKLSWLSRDAKMPDREKLYQQHALKMFMVAYENENFPICGMDSPTLSYLIGELARRVGEYDTAYQFIGRVINTRGINARLKDRAIDIKDMLAADRKKAEQEQQTQQPQQPESTAKKPK